jgi:hypothetical protein
MASPIRLYRFVMEPLIVGALLSGRGGFEAAGGEGRVLSWQHPRRSYSRRRSSRESTDPHSRDLPPFDFRLLGPKVFGNLLRRLADDFKAPDEGSLQGGVQAERMEVLAGELRQNVVDLVKDMSDVLTR